MNVPRPSRVAVVRSGVVLVAVFAAIGGLVSGKWLAQRALASRYPGLVVDVLSGKAVPASVLPRTRRDRRPLTFGLDDTNSVRMQGVPDSEAQRWLDIAGNAYAKAFVSGFSYAGGGDGGPLVRLRIDPRGDTLRGRIEARGLKPNFAYQVKLNGVFEHREAFEAIGAAGRWRFPGKETNYTDIDYKLAFRKSRAAAYIFFDFLITDAQGNAASDLVLEHSLHVLWNASRQRDDGRSRDVVAVWVDASAPDTYVRPKARRTLELLWAEREAVRYDYPGDRVALPPGKYDAEITLTEESFHAEGNDGGWWAAAFRAPVSFVITE